MKRLAKFPDINASEPGKRHPERVRGEAQPDSGSGTTGSLMWAVNPGDYEAVLDDWLDSTALRGRPWTGVSSDAADDGGPGDLANEDLPSTRP